MLGLRANSRATCPWYRAARQLKTYLFAFAGIFVFCATTAAAAPDTAQFRALGEPALMVRDCAHVLLISITRAGNRLVAGGENGAIIYSDDNGQSWHQAVVPVSVTITTVAFATAKDGWAAGAYGVVLHTTDGGVTWVRQLDGIQVNQLQVDAATRFQTANPASPAADTAVRRAGIFTQDGPDKPFLTILASSPSDAMVFGGYRMCIRTDDGGASWNDCSLDIPDPVSHNLYDAIGTGSSVYLAGEAGDVFRSDDQGKTFTSLAPPASSTLFGIFGTHDATLIAYGVSNGLFRSADQGKAWTSIPIDAQADLTAGAVLESGTVVILSEAGGTFASMDDGQSFQMLSLNEGMALYGIQQAANGDVVLVGSDGVRVVPAADFVT